MVVIEQRMPHMILATVVALGVFGLLVVVSGLPAVVAQDEEEATPAPTPAVPKPAVIAPSPEPAPAAFDPAIPRPPVVTGGVYASSLANEDVFPQGICVTGWAWGEVISEGFLLSVVGQCVETNDTADVALPGRGIRIGDGDLALDFKVVAGEQRAQISVYVRNSSGKLIGASFNPAKGEARLFSFADGNTSVIASRADAQGLAIPSDWNRLAVRVRGSELWLLLNDDPLLYARDVLTEPGGVGIRLLREGDPNDDDEVTVIVRSLTLSTVSGAGEGRAPSYTRP